MNTIEKAPKILESKKRIRFQHCDPFNHLNNAEYLNYFINAREDQLIKHFDLDIYKMAQEKGISWVVGSNQIAYIRPAFTMETVVIQSQLIAFSPTDIKVELRMFNEDKTVLKSIMWSTFVHFNLMTQKKATHDDSFMELFESVLNPVPQKSFEERVASFRKKQ